MHSQEVIAKSQNVSWAIFGALIISVYEHHVILLTGGWGAVHRLNIHEPTEKNPLAHGDVLYWHQPSIVLTLTRDILCSSHTQNYLFEHWPFCSNFT